MPGITTSMSMQSGRAVCACRNPSSPLSAIAPRLQATHSTHAIAPESVLAVAADVLGLAPPPAFLLAVGGESFDLGAPLSPAAQANLEAAWACLGELLAAPDAAAWQRRVGAAMG